MKNIRLVILVSLISLFLAGCTAGPNEFVRVASSDGSLAGFWAGLWHGIISPLTFAVSLFTDNINVYEVRNSGNWYDFGFILGAGILFRGGSKGVHQSKKAPKAAKQATFVSV